MTDKNALIDQIYEWVEVSGRALELRTARAFWDGGAATVQPSFAYTDPTDKKTAREGDVLATFDWTTKMNPAESLDGTLSVVVECKSGTAKPWIAFEPNDQRPHDLTLDQWLVRAWSPWTPVNDLIAQPWDGQAPYSEAPAASHIVAATLGPKGQRDSD